MHCAALMTTVALAPVMCIGKLDGLSWLSALGVSSSLLVVGVVLSLRVLDPDRSRMPQQVRRPARGGGDALASWAGDAPLPLRPASELSGYPRWPLPCTAAAWAPPAVHRHLVCLWHLCGQLERAFNVACHPGRHAAAHPVPRGHHPGVCNHDGLLRLCGSRGLLVSAAARSWGVAAPRPHWALLL